MTSNSSFSTLKIQSAEMTTAGRSEDPIFQRRLPQSFLGLHLGVFRIQSPCFELGADRRLALCIGELSLRPFGEHRGKRDASLLCEQSQAVVRLSWDADGCGW